MYTFFKKYQSVSNIYLQQGQQHQQVLGYLALHVLLEVLQLHGLPEDLFLPVESSGYIYL